MVVLIGFFFIGNVRISYFKNILFMGGGGGVDLIISSCMENIIYIFVIIC